MNILIDTINHSVIHDFWQIISKDPEKKVFKRNYMRGEINGETKFFKVLKPVNNFQIH